MTLNTINFILSLYVIPVILCYVFTKFVYKYVFDEEPSFINVVFVLAPLVNIVIGFVFGLITVIEGSIRIINGIDKKHNGRFSKTFFRTKKERK